MKNSPCGFGYWVAFANAMTPSPLAQDVEETCRILQALGAGWIAPRAGMDGWNDGGLTLSALASYKQLGIDVYPWIYTRPQGIQATVDAALKLLETGNVDGIILDAEAEYLAESGAATRLADAIRAAVDDAWVAHAPLDNIALHPTFPWREIVVGSAEPHEPPRLDAVMPQLYAWEHNDAGHAAWQQKCEPQWTAWERANPQAAVPRSWIGACYRPKLRGGSSTPALPLQTVVDDVVAFRTSNPRGSLYAIDAALTLAQRPILAALIELAGGADAHDLSTVLGQQEALARLGFEPGPIDGRKGRQTVIALKAFQKSVGLLEDGVVGPTTRAALDAALSRPS
ncbi:hypothetical protein BH09MYX1_BH09MYX1_13240 [soil metagenome]